MIGLRRGMVTGTWDEGKTTMHFKIEYPDGMEYEGDHRFVRKDYVEVAGSIINADGKVAVELTFKQTRRNETANASDATVDEVNHGVEIDEVIFAMPTD